MTKPPTFLQAGFRPFFLLAGLAATLLLSVWPFMLGGALQAPGHWPMLVWHAHELVFGFVAAAIAGFLLTAVPNWTRSAPLAGLPLALLAAVWLGGRAAVAGASLLPAWGVAAIDMAFLPLLAGFVGTPILRARLARNYVVVAILLLLTTANAAVHLQLLGLRAASARPALLAAVHLVIVLVTVISGRIVPSFTSNHLRAAAKPFAIEPQPRLEALLIPLLLSTAISLVAFEGSVASGILQLAASLLLLLRQLGWRAVATRGHPILWILHLGHGWLVLGYGLGGLAVFVSALPASAALHALTAGGIGTMVIGVMSRVALGHTGREIVATRATVVAYWLVLLGGATRVLAPLLALPDLLLLAGFAWAAGYGLFLLGYLPILLRPRVAAEVG